MMIVSEENTEILAYVMADKYNNSFNRHDAVNQSLLELGENDINIAKELELMWHAIDAFVDCQND